MEQLCEGGGNVFAEVGLPHPEQELLKALLTIQLCRIIKERNVTQVQAAEIRGIMNGALREIAVRPAGNSRGEISLIQRPGAHRSLLPNLARLCSLFVRSPKEDR